MLLNIEKYVVCTRPRTLWRLVDEYGPTRSLVRSLDRPIFFWRIGESHCDRIHCSVNAVLCFDNSFVGKQPVAWKEYCAKYWLKELKESVDRATGRRDIT